MLVNTWITGYIRYKQGVLIMENKEKLTKAKYFEWQASLFGACSIAFGLGLLLSSYFGQFAIVLILIGVILHSWGMYKIHQRNKK